MPQNRIDEISKTEHLDDIQELILPCVDSTAMTAVTLFGEHISRPFTELHNTIFSYIDDPLKRLVAIAAPRGFGKTTLMGLCFPARLALFRIVPYIVYVSATVKEAAAKVKILAQELQENEIVKELFGNVKGVKWAEENGEIELSDENGSFCFIQAKGAGSQVRGLKWKRYRPGLFIVDDLEDLEESQNEENRKKLKRWFFSSLMGAMDNAEFSDSRLVLIGTIVHQDSLLANLIDEKREFAEEQFDVEDDVKAIIEAMEQFHTVRLEACDDKFESCWPEFLSTSAILAKKEAYRKRGQLDVFYMEYRNLVVAGDTASFLPDMFRYYKEEDETFQSRLYELETVIIVDPAKTVNPKSANTAIICVSLNANRRKIYFRDCKNAKLDPNETMDIAFTMADQYNTSTIGVEVTGLNNYISYPFNQAAAKRKRFYDIIEIKALKDKALRVRGLIPFYRMGVMYHNYRPDIHGPLESQLMSFPYAKYWDVMDALANFIELFDMGNRNFSSSDDFDSIDVKSDEDEFKALYAEDRMFSKQLEFAII